MNKKGFTLAELMAVLVILAVLSSIVFLSVSKVIESVKIKSCKAQEKTLSEAAKMYMIDHPEYDESAGITILFLKEGKYIDSDIKNPMTNQEYKNQTYLVKDKSKYILKSDAGVNHEKVCSDITSNNYNLTD